MKMDRKKLGRRYFGCLKGIKPFGEDDELTAHEDILKWDDERKVTKSREGITKIPERFKLDTIMLELKET